MKLYENGAYLIHGKDVVINGPEAAAEVAGKTGKQVTPEDAKKEPIADGILQRHHTSGNMFGLTCAKKYGGIYVPPHQAVIHQFAREMLAGGGKMILGSDSHTRYGALGTMAVGEGGPELVKQLLSKTYDIDMPGVVGI